MSDTEVSAVDDQQVVAKWRPVQAGVLPSWDASTDVIVVGFGCAGAAAAIAAAGGGNDVLLVERAGGPGGAAIESGGWIYLGGGTPVQQGCGFADTAEDMRRFLVAALGPGADEEKIECYAAGSVDHFEWLAGLGVPFGRELVDRRVRSPGANDGLSWMGEDAHPFIDVATPAPRGHRPGGSGLQGRTFMGRLAEVATKSSNEVLSDTRLRELAVGGDGRVIGVVCRRFGRDLRLRARRGVVLTTGGFVFNDAMVQLHAPNLVGHSKVGTVGDDGAGIALAQRLGAAVRHMEAAQVAPAIAPALLPRSVVVDGAGHRFINEDTYPGRVGQFALFRHDARAFAILDEETYESIPAEERMGQVPQHVAPTAEALAEEIGVPPDGLAATVDAYNRAAARGEDPIHHKRATWLQPLRPPLGAFDLRHRAPLATAPVTGESGFNVFTLGGLRTGLEGQVLLADGSPVPGLYAAGRAASGLHGWGYITGTSIGDGTFFGRRAGRAAARGLT